MYAIARDVDIGNRKSTYYIIMTRDAALRFHRHYDHVKCGVYYGAAH